MKVVFLSHSSGSENLGGAELSLLHLIDEWKAKRPSIEVFVVARNPRGSLQPELDRRGVDHESLDFSSWVRPHLEPSVIDSALELRMDSWAVDRLVAIIRNVQPDLVVTNTVVSPWAALAARLCGVPHAWLIHEFGDLDHGLEFKLGREVTLADVNLLSDLVVANSQAVRDSIAPWIESDKLMVSYPSIDFEHVRSLAESEGSAHHEWSLEGALHTVLVGRVSASKGQWRLVTAIAQLRDEGIDVVASIVGLATPSDEAALTALIEELGVGDRVRLVGETTNPFCIMADADVGIMASDCEAFGRVTVEYMTLGRPVIASRTGANPELIVEGETGWLFDPDNPADLARALRDAAGNREVLKERGENARRSVDEKLAGAFPAEALLERLEEAAQSETHRMSRLPAILREWIDLPREIESYRRAMHANRQFGYQSLEWRVGRVLTAPARALYRVGRWRP